MSNNADAAAAAPPPYVPDAQHDKGQPGQPSQPGSPAPAGQAINMQPMGQSPMARSGPNQSVTPLHLLSERQEYVDCQFCHKRARTRVDQKGQGMQVLTGVLLCLVCVCLAPLPCCLHWFEQTNWFCSECGKQIASRTPESPIYVFPPPEALNVPSYYASQNAPPQNVASPAAGDPPPSHLNPQSPGAPGSAPVSPGTAPGAPISGSSPAPGQPQSPPPQQQQQPYGAPSAQPSAAAQSPEIQHAPAEVPGQAGPLPAKN